MKRLQVQRWTGQLLTPKSRHPLQLEQYQNIVSTRSKSTATATDQGAEQLKLTSLPSPHPGAALSSAKLAALHARLSLPKELPLQTLSRTLVDSSADSSENFNNLSLSKIGSALLSYQVTEWLLCKYPRLPMAIFFAAMKAYIGPATLHRIGIEWGVEAAASPGGEVDPGLLQFSKLRPGQRPILGESERNDEKSFYRRGMSSRVIYDDEFGDLVFSPPKDGEPQPTEHAYSSFVRALVGSLYAHSGRRAANNFIIAHILSRHLDMHKLFEFKHPMRDLIKLCAREGFQYPIARLLSETGRCSNAAVFVVGIYSGTEKLGEGAGPSLTEGRTRAAIAALKAWYLYTPNIGEAGCLPSEMEDESEKGREWEPVHIDPGEIV